MTKIKWFYPETLSEATQLLTLPGYIPLGGGTELIQRPLKGVEAIVSLRELELNQIDLGNEQYYFGSMCTYADVLHALEKDNQWHVLYKSLEQAANTPCRNRITLGGSTAFVPKWSDLAGALLVMDADVHLAGSHEEKIPFATYQHDPRLRKGRLITAISFRNVPHLAAHYREVRTHNDMPRFTVTVLLNMREETIIKAGIVLVGGKERFTRLEKLEHYLLGKSREQIDTDTMSDLVDVSFRSKLGTEAAYLVRKAQTETARCVIFALENR
jgi:CO/xanthine dehydrogenase FAD-binding subunit